MTTVPWRGMRRAFLTARWTNLAILTYAVPPALLEAHLPAGLALDLRGGSAFASLVVFDFVDTRVLGVSWPGFRDFPELNLRFYVRHGTQRGVVFVREFVPRAPVAWIARAAYNEPYVAAPIESLVEDDPRGVVTRRRLHWQGRVHELAMTGTKPAFRPAEDSDEHFFKEHQWGFGRDRHGVTRVYEVRHPVWDVYPVRSWSLDLDWGAVYGPEWSRLAGEEPVSVALAAGSAVTVYPSGRIG